MGFAGSLWYWPRVGAFGAQSPARPVGDILIQRLGLTQLATEVLAVIAPRDAAKPKIGPEDAQRLLDAANAAILCIGGTGGVPAKATRARI